MIDNTCVRVEHHETSCIDVYGRLVHAYRASRAVPSTAASARFLVLARTPLHRAHHRRHHRQSNRAAAVHMSLHMPVHMSTLIYAQIRMHVDSHVDAGKHKCLYTRLNTCSVDIYTVNMHMYQMYIRPSTSLNTDVCVHMRTHVYTHVYMSTHMSTCLHTCPFMSIFFIPAVHGQCGTAAAAHRTKAPPHRTCVHACVRACVHACVRACMCACVCACMCACSHAYSTSQPVIGLPLHAGCRSLRDTQPTPAVLTSGGSGGSGTAHSSLTAMLSAAAPHACPCNACVRACARICCVWRAVACEFLAHTRNTYSAPGRSPTTSTFSVHLCVRAVCVRACVCACACVPLLRRCHRRHVRCCRVPQHRSAPTGRSRHRAHSQASRRRCVSQAIPSGRFRAQTSVCRRAHQCVQTSVHSCV